MKKIDKKLIGFPNTTVETTLFSREEERLYSKKEEVKPKTNLVDMPKGEPPKIEKLFQNGFKSGHICIVGILQNLIFIGPTGCGFILFK
jgi:hypothetical protein